ncbi:hypothetical protein GGR53DRAFT_491969 [Hypoxylon sp. FL1150]|nr:hypothetical protein GGR53DRAFT_491969 [Hypoxylon sp. FL1150]
MESFLLGRFTRASYYARHALAPIRCMSLESRTARSPKREPRRQLYYTPPLTDDLQRCVIGEPEVQPGEHVFSACEKHDLSFPNNLRPLKIKFKENRVKCSVSTSGKHCLEKYSLKYLDKFEHPFAKSVLNMHVAQKHKPLWVSITVYPIASAFPCKVAKRRFKHAFFEALAAHGYDREGRRVASEDSQSVIADLYGTVQLTCGDPKIACTMKFTDLLKQAMKVVSAVELALARDKNGRRIKSTWEPPKQQKPFRYTKTVTK